MGRRVIRVVFEFNCAQHSRVMDLLGGLAHSVLPPTGPTVSETETDEPESAMEESDAPVQEAEEGNQGAFTRDWIKK